MSFIKNRYIQCSPIITDIADTEYVVIGSTIFPEASAQDILGIDMISYINDEGAYDIQIVDKSKNNVVAEQTFTNNKPELQTFERILFQPNITTILEVSARLAKDSKATLLRIYDIKIWCH